MRASFQAGLCSIIIRFTPIKHINQISNGYPTITTSSQKQSRPDIFRQTGILLKLLKKVPDNDYYKKLIQGKFIDNTFEIVCHLQILLKLILDFDSNISCALALFNNLNNRVAVL